MLGAGATIVGPVSPLVDATETPLSRVVDDVNIEIEFDEFAPVELLTNLDEPDVSFWVLEVTDLLSASTF